MSRLTEDRRDQLARQASQIQGRISAVTGLKKTELVMRDYDFRNESWCEMPLSQLMKLIEAAERPPEEPDAWECAIVTANGLRLTEWARFIHGASSTNLTPLPESRDVPAGTPHMLQLRRNGVVVGYEPLLIDGGIHPNAATISLEWSGWGTAKIMERWTVKGAQ